MGCHATGPFTFDFGGTVYESDGTTPAANVQVGVRDANGLRTAYSASNGNFWVVDIGTPMDWGTAEVRVRNESGEVTKPNAAAAGCNGCHTGSEALLEP